MLRILNSKSALPALIVISNVWLALVSMDIELGEEKALNDFDIQRFNPRLLCVIANLSKRPRMIEDFASHGYRHIKEYKVFDNVSLYFQRQAEWQSPAKAC